MKRIGGDRIPKGETDSVNKKNLLHKGYSRAAPPPPSEPAPPNQPLISSFRHHYQKFNQGRNKSENRTNASELLMKVPDAGVAG